MMDSSVVVSLLLLTSLQNIGLSMKEFSLARYNDTAVYANNSVIDVNLVGEGYPGLVQTDGGALECHTDDTTCCRGIDNPKGTGSGEWYSPDGTVVPPPPPGGGTGFYRTRDHMVVRLNRVGTFDTLLRTGSYKCEIPGTGGIIITRYITLTTNETLCRNLLEIPNGAITYTPPRGVSAILPGGQRYRGTIATYSCSPGYQLINGSSLRACGPGGTWNGTEPSCQTTSEAVTQTFATERFSPTTSTAQKLNTGGTPAPSSSADTSSSTGAVIAVITVVLSLITVTATVIIVISVLLWRWSKHTNNEKADENKPRPFLKDQQVHRKTNSLTGETKTVGETQFQINQGDGSGDTNRPVLVAEFGTFVSEHHARGNQKFFSKFQTLDKGEEGHTLSVSNSKESRKANRFKNIMIYDDNRIVLQPLPGEKCQSDYINACYVDGFTSPKKFIATQGPLPNTVNDFWRMVWQERPSAIVMLTNCEEGGRVKCEQYWPESGNKSYGPFQVIITDKQILADYTVRSFVINNTIDESSNPLKLTQFHFTTWPDHGVPEYATPLLAFYRRVRSFAAAVTGPLILHCSAGVGRTGTYVTLDNVFDQVKAEGLVDIDGIVVKARNQRMKMVQSKDQYIFIHDAILEFLTCGDTQISPANLRVTTKKLNEEDPNYQLCTGYQHQFNVLEQVSPNPIEVNCFTALKHPDKNRGDKYLPVEQFRVMLFGERPDYIHAVTANGYKQRNAYIIAQNPMESTVRNFWKVIFDRSCGAVVMLSQLKENGEEVCAKYWPEESCESFGEFTVEQVRREESCGFTIRKMNVNDNKTYQSHQVTQFHVTNWSPDGTCSNLKVLTDVIEEVAKVQRRTGNNPVLVHCSDTVSRSGMFCAIATTIDRCKTEGAVDVFQVVKALRIHKPGAVLNVEQFKVIHEAVLQFLDSFDTYANFQD